MNAFTITEMHYLVEILFCDFLRPVLLCIYGITFSGLLFALFHKHQIGTNWDIAPMP